VSLDESRRNLDDGVEIWPWASFCRALWEGDLV
jgi:hypothetical protein